MSTLVEIGLMIAIIILASGMARWLFGSKHGRTKGIANDPDRISLEKEKLRIKDRAETRAMLERLATSKLEVIKDAIAMGYDDAQLARLDKRLEKLVGADKISEVLNDEAAQPAIDSDLLDTDLEAEIERMRRSREKH